MVRSCAELCARTNATTSDTEIHRQCSPSCYDNALVTLDSMQTRQSYKHRHIIGLACVVALAGTGCSAHASIRAGATTGSTTETARTSGSEAKSSEPRSSSLALRQADDPARHADADRPVESAAPAPAAASDHGHEQGRDKDADKLPTVAAPASEGDHDRGHGNDADRVDEDNPGKSKRNKKGKKSELVAAAPSDGDGDRDRGHGNDADRVDEDNPGQSKKDKSKKDK